jgi:hypothetical protein
MRRALSSRRLLIAVVMILFPPSMLYIIGYAAGSRFPEFAMAGTLGLIAWLSLILWSTTNVYAELEGRGWLYLTSRSRGRLAVLFGKMLTSVLWAYAICQISLCLCLAVCHFLMPLRDPFLVWWSFSLLLALACIAYSCILSMIGTLFQKRAMMIGVGYLMLVELLLSFLPAIINKVTIRFHLQGLCFRWMGWILPSQGVASQEADLRSFYLAFGQNSQWFHIAMILGLAAFSLGVAAFTIRNSEYVTSDET